jgi:hypothetical protein
VVLKKIVILDRIIIAPVPHPNLFMGNELQPVAIAKRNPVAIAVHLALIYHTATYVVVVIILKL